MTLQWLSQSQSKWSLGEFSVLRYSNHFLLVGVQHCSAWNIIINDSALLLFTQIEIFSGMLTEYFNCKYFPLYTCETLGGFLWICLSGRNPAGEIIDIEATLNQRQFISTQIIKLQKWWSVSLILLSNFLEISDWYNSLGQKWIGVWYGWCWCCYCKCTEKDFASWGMTWSFFIVISNGVVVQRQATNHRELKQRGFWVMQGSGLFALLNCG